MKKRMLALSALALVFVVAAAPPALADHCHRCSLSQLCRPAFSGGGAAFCDDFTTPGVCVLSGRCGGAHPFVEIDESFAAEFTVASVERLEEPQQPATDQTRVASLETQPTATR